MVLHNSLVISCLFYFRNLDTSSTFSVEDSSTSNFVFAFALVAFEGGPHEMNVNCVTNMVENKPAIVILYTYLSINRENRNKLLRYRVDFSQFTLTN